MTPFGSSTCFIWPYCATVSIPLKGGRQKKPYLSWPQHIVPAWEVGREGDVPGVFKAGSQPGVTDEKVPLGPGELQGEVTSHKDAELLD